MGGRVVGDNFIKMARLGKNGFMLVTGSRVGAYSILHALESWFCDFNIAVNASTMLARVEEHMRTQNKDRN